MKSAPRAQTNAAFCRPLVSFASPSTDKLPMPKGIRGTGIGMPPLMKFGAMDATFEAPAKPASVTVR